jgi:putative aminopeptidase FrvX
LPQEIRENYKETRKKTTGNFVPHSPNALAKPSIGVAAMIDEIGGLVVSRPKWDLEELLINLQDIQSF